MANAVTDVESASLPGLPLDIRRWRRAERKKQIDARLAVSANDRADMAARIRSHLMQAIASVEGSCVSVFWPIRGEPDLRPLVPHVIAMGGTCALPVVVERGQPLVFRAWAPGEPLQRGVWNIPVPAAGREIEPDIVVAPTVAFDSACYRLGYGGGYFDRTLAAIRKRPRVFGVGYSLAAVPTIHPQAHDIPMDSIVTHEGVIERQGSPR